MTVRQKLGELLNEVQYRGDSVVVTKAGKPVAAIIDIELFNRLRLLDAEFDRLAGQLRASYKGSRRRASPRRWTRLSLPCGATRLVTVPSSEGHPRYERPSFRAHQSGRRARQDRQPVEGRWL
ncbi:MAG: type II toxin-antitoxin system prevent-host-death family antitoxin [Thermoleophilia bacterium]|nr:type II toxin-antitoxin system prevent-host-death family antitoxin [Thermoleophilia bacterium]